MMTGSFLRILTILVIYPLLELSAFASGKVYQLTDVAEVRNISIVMHNTDVLQFDEIIGSYAVGDPEIADVLPIRGNEAYIQGKKLGNTNLNVMSADGTRRAVFNIEVTLNARSILKTIKRAEPEADIDISSVNGRIILAGNAPDAPSAARILEITSKFVDSPEDVINAITVANSQQVMLKVRFLEVSRSRGKEFGVRWLANSSRSGARSGDSSVIGGVVDPKEVLKGSTSSFSAALAQFTAGSLDIDVAIQALEAKGVTRRLAEPNLVALSGQQATFLAGGEIPYKVTKLGVETNTEFKPYGVRITFTPIVLRNGVINLKLAPEFSSPDLAGAVDGQPSLLTRRAETTVELRDGQTFVIAGLLDGLNQRNVDQVPGFGDIPVLGSLFRSAAFQKRETELIILVTPQIIKPLTPGTPIVSPLDTLKSSSEPELFLNGQLESKPKRQRSSEPVGHILDIGG